MKHEERDLRDAVAEYLQWNKYEYRFDLSADLKLTIGQAVRNKKIHKRAFPDLTVFLSGGKTIFFELKKSRDEVYKRNGEYKNNKHLQEQIAYHKRLNKLGYETYFVWLLSDIIEILQKSKEV